MGEDGGGRDGGGFGPQDQGSERYGRPSGGDGSGPFRVGPAAFGACQQQHAIRTAAMRGRRDGGQKDRKARLLVQEIAQARAHSEGYAQRRWSTDFGRTQTARLLAAFVRDRSEEHTSELQSLR